MAAENHIQCLQDAATCSICLEFFKDPVMITDCGHNFCQVCITQCEEGLHTDIFCPQCRETFPQRNLRPNRQLVTVTDVAKRLSMRAAERGERVCEEHGEALKLFCETDQKPLCLICRESWAHQAHAVAPIQEAAQRYKKQIQMHLENLMEERRRLEELKLSETQKHQKYQQKAAAERQKIVSEFEQLRQFLEEQEQLLLSWLGELGREIEKSQEETGTKLSEQISHLNSLIREMEEKCQQPPSDLLQDIRSSLRRCKRGEFQLLGMISPGLEIRLRNLSEQNLTLKETFRKFQDALPSDLEKGMGEPQGSYSKVKVTLDPNTAHPWLSLSEDWTSVRGADTWQDRPDMPERFDMWCCVLGREGFTSGKHCWEVEVGKGEGWALGVARESVRRKGQISRNPEGGIWAVQWWEGDFWALTAPGPTPLSLKQLPRRVRVYLDYEGGKVAFLDADTEDLIYTFPPALFAGGKIHPWLWVCRGSQLTL
ncbi:zinc finger protein RFP [Alligator mississippiensis]|uniref:zinc finger protein RFP n=1 Tax=Alligator mississippiensis TaxID=8496 RepID=UPI0007119DBB|nr:zinc finger protein RFP [Alligator mississippiensis]